MKKIVISIMVAVMFLGAFAGCGGKSLDIYKYVTVEFTGLDGTAKAKVNIDDSFEKELMTAAGYKDGDDPFEYLDLYLSLDYDIDKSENLSNGDKVVVSIKTDDDILKKYDISISNKSKTFTVEGLEKGTEMDVFENMELVVEGESPFLRVSGVSRSTDSFLKAINYSIQDNNNLKIGDSVLVKASYNQAQADEAGYTILETEKIFTIDNADKVVETFEEIPADFAEKLRAETTDTTVSAFAKYGGLITYSVSDNATYNMYEKDNIYAEPVMEDSLLLTPKPNFGGYSFQPGSTLYVSYIVKVSGKDGITDEIPFIVKVPGLILREDGTMTASFEKADYYYYAKMSDTATLIRKIEDEHRTNFITTTQQLDSSAVPVKKDDEKDSKDEGALPVRYIVNKQEGIDEEYFSAIILKEDNRFFFVVNLLHGMGEMEGTYKEDGDVIIFTPDNIKFSGSKGDDTTSFTLTKEGDSYAIGNIEFKSDAYTNNGIGGVYEGDKFTLTDSKPASVTK